MKNKKTIIILILVLTIGIVGLTIAYFANTTSINNEFSTNPYGTTVVEEFISPDNWLPGTTTDKTITVTNTGSVDEAVRISYTEEWKAKDNTILSGLIDSNGILTNNTENSEHAAIINLSDNNDWTYSNGYYYYNYRLAPQETTSSLIDSVTFNSKVKSDSNCTTETNGSTKTVTCNSTNAGYDGATYKLTFNIETVQYNKYKEAWGVDIATFNMKPMSAQQFISKANPISVTNYTDGDIHEMYTFQHDATEQTPALTDYRYIGNDPYNYVYFNCDSLDNQSAETCEVWRIIGVFDVEDEDGNFETRFKLVRGSALLNSMQWDNRDSLAINFGINDWNGSFINEYLNGDFFSNLSTISKMEIGSAIYYLGGKQANYNDDSPCGSTDEIYEWERGTSTYTNSSNNCINNPSTSICSTPRNIKWIGKIGLMYPSDAFMVYAKGVEENCYINPFNCRNNKPSVNPSNSWIYNTNIANNGDSSAIWLISPTVDPSNFAFGIRSYGMLSDDTVTDNRGIQPTLYLKSNVKLVDGDGIKNNPYRLGYNSSDGGYTTYTKGQTVTYDNQQYYVMSTSEGNKSYVKLLKATPLTASEINAFNTDYTSTNGEYPYLENNTCNISNTTNCTTNYNNSSIKTIVDNWSSNYNNDLVSIGGYKARLVNESDIMNNFSYENYVSDTDVRIQTTSDTPSWVLLNGMNYWSMRNAGDSNRQVNGIASNLTSENVYNKLYIRPVINLKKCALTNTCE